MVAPTDILIASGLSAASFAFGYFAASATSSNSEPVPFSEDNGQPDDGDLTLVKAGLLEPCKLVLVVRTDIPLSMGKISELEGTLKCYKALSQLNSGLVRHWEYTGQAKIALKAKSETQLVNLEKQAKSLNLCARAVEYTPERSTQTQKVVLAIGPAPVELVNQVTGKLRLY